MDVNRPDGTIWITGAGKGIGRALALKLAALGHAVAASARTEADLLSLAAEGAGLAGRIVPVPLDILDEDATREAVARIGAEIGPISLAILNAGTHSEITAANFEMAAFRRVMETNLFGTAHCLSALLPVMRARRSGRIAVVSSVAGYRGLPTAGAYSASKAALIALCEAFKPELEGEGVEMILINPGFVDTPLTRRNTFPMPFLIEADDAADRIVRGLGSGRFEIVFPRRMAIAMKILGILPYWLFFPVTRRMVRPGR